MANKIPDRTGVFGVPETIGSVFYRVCFNYDEFQNAIESGCDERGCKDCKYFSFDKKKCNRPPLVINFKPFEK